MPAMIGALFYSQTQFAQSLTAKIKADATQDHIKLNLRWAELAVKYARSKMIVGAANKDHAKKQRAIACLSKVRANDQEQSRSSKDILEYVGKIAEESSQHGCGNCGEQSALAFWFLYKKGVKPLDWAAVDKQDHAFVILQRHPKSRIEDYKTWGELAVVSDPWGNGAFRARDIVSRGVYGPENSKLYYKTLLRFD